MTRPNQNRTTAITWCAIATSYAALIALLLTPLSQPCGDMPTVWLRLGLTATLFILLVITAMTGRRQVFWLAPQVIMLGFLLLSLPNELRPFDHAICFISP